MPVFIRGVDIFVMNWDEFIKAENKKTIHSVKM